MLKTPGLSRVQRILLAAILAAILSSAWLTVQSLLELVRAQRALDEAHRTVHVADMLIQQVLDAETGQRGYLIAGSSEYLAPYHSAIASIRQTRRTLESLPLNADAVQLLQQISKSLDQKLDELAVTVAFRTAGEAGEAASVVKTGEGRGLMENIRSGARQFAALQDTRIRELRDQHDDAVARTYVTMGLSFISNISLLVFLVLRSMSFARKTWANEKDLEARNSELTQLAHTAMEHNEHMQKLSELVRFLQTSQDTVEAHTLLSERLPHLLHARAGALYVMASSRNQMKKAFAWGDDSYVEHFEPEECWALRSGQAFEQPEGTGATTCKHLHERVSISRQGVLCLPIASHGELTGLVVLDPIPSQGVKPDHLTARQRQTTVEQVSLSLGNLRLRDSLRQQSIKDALTGLYNRRFLDESLRREILRCQRKESEDIESVMAVLMIDVDHFKQFNDKFGHELGDRVLSNVAQTLAQNVRASDLVARFGGEEFTVVLPSATPEAALERAEVLREAVANMAPISGKNELHHSVKISIGVACLPVDGTTAEELIHKADMALYRSKKDGRNRVTLSDTPVAKG